MINLRPTAIVLSFLLGGSAAIGSRAASASPPIGSSAPAVTLPDLDGTTVRTADLSDRTLVLVFGELSHEGTKRACADLLAVLEDPRLREANPMTIMIVAQEATAAALKAEAGGGRFPATILHDPQREAFGAYRILVIPTVVIVDRHGTVVQAMPGPVPQFKDVLTESLMLAAGKELPAGTLPDGSAVRRPTTPEGERADRLVRLGTELVHHGLFEEAEARFAEAMAIQPGHVAAKLALADLMLRQDRDADAEAIFRSVLTAHPDSTDARLGIAAVQIKRGGDELESAQRTLAEMVAKDPNLPKARYLLGRAYEQTGNIPAAAIEYRRAAELLLDR
ncbi:MAG: tetratricopeptide repeat protein [Phycisphaerales bacterium]|nr:tetratricopeptide repeat protein [Phycisphaerales bacterium]